MVCAGWDRKLRNTIYHYMHTHPRQPPQPDPDHNKEPLLYMRKAQVSKLHHSRYICIHSVLGETSTFSSSLFVLIWPSSGRPFKISVLCLGNIHFFFLLIWPFSGQYTCPSRYPFCAWETSTSSSFFCWFDHFQVVTLALQDIHSVLGKHPLLFLLLIWLFSGQYTCLFKISVLCLENLHFFCFRLFADFTIFSFTLNQLCRVQNTVPFDAIIWLSCELKFQVLLKRKQLRALTGTLKGEEDEALIRKRK